MFSVSCARVRVLARTLEKNLCTVVKCLRTQRENVSAPKF